MLTQEQIQLASKREYFISNSRFISGRIMEYDIRAANISILREYGIIDDNYYNYMLSVDKQYREQFIGWQIKNEKEESGKKSALEGSSTYKIIYDGITKAKLDLFEQNNIQVNEVIRIANDAVYINRLSNLAVTKVGNFIEFKLKMIAENCIKLKNLIVFSWHNENGLNIDVKGINDTAKLLHQNYMLSFIGSVLLVYERAGILEAIHLVESFYNDYLTRSLNKEYYRELNSGSMFKVMNSGYYISDIDNIELIDISYNANVIRDLWQILISKYK